VSWIIHELKRNRSEEQGKWRGEELKMKNSPLRNDERKFSSPWMGEGWGEGD
jgi:hypothetical protein